MITAAKAKEKTDKNNKKYGNDPVKEVNVLLKYVEKQIKQAIEIGTHRVFIDFSIVLSDKPTRTALVRLEQELNSLGYEVNYNDDTFYISWFCDKPGVLAGSWIDKLLLGENVEKPWRMKVTEELKDLAKQYKPEVEKMLNE